MINQTEALVSIDINSGKATREHNIEDTALKTNLEASDEIARQLRLRDLAGLIVIDFIDMEEKRNNRSVERRLKEALKNDRARIQVGRISHFGLLEMSRQRLRPGMVEGSTKPARIAKAAASCARSSSCALSVLRGIEDYLLARKAENLTVKCHPDVAVYIFNEKRDNLLVLETTYGISIFIVPSADIRTAESVIERAGERDRLDPPSPGGADGHADDRSCRRRNGRGRRGRERRKQAEEDAEGELRGDAMARPIAMAAPMPRSAAGAAGGGAGGAAVAGRASANEGEPTARARTRPRSMPRPNFLPATEMTTVGRRAGSR